MWGHIKATLNNDAGNVVGWSEDVDKLEGGREFGAQ